MKICEVYDSIIGEGRFAGIPGVIIRTSGCNLRCEWCDTKYALSGGKKKTIDEVLTLVRRMERGTSLITGGEPLIQEQVYPLMDKLIESDVRIILETNGTIDISKIPGEVFVSLDVKPPSSGHSNDICTSNLRKNFERIDYKFPISGRDDFAWSLNIVEEYELTSKGRVYFSPIYGKMEMQLLAEWIMKSHNDIFMNFQLHKLIWDDERKK